MRRKWGKRAVQLFVTLGLLVGNVHGEVSAPSGAHGKIGSSAGATSHREPTLRELRERPVVKVSTPTRGPGAGVYEVACAPDGRSFTVSSVKDWGINRYTIDGKEIPRKDGAFPLRSTPKKEVIQGRLSPDGRYYLQLVHDRKLRETGGAFTSWIVGDLFTGELISPPKEDLESFSADGKRLLSPAWRWDIQSRRLEKMPERAGGLSFLDISGDGRLIAGLDFTAHSVALVDTESGQRRNITAFSEDEHPRAITISPDGRFVAMTVGDQDGAGVGLLDVKKGEFIADYPTPKGVWSRAAFSPDSRQLVFGGDDGFLNVIDLTTGKELYRLKAHTGSISSVSFCPDGRRLVTGGDDGLALVWDLSRLADPTSVTRLWPDDVWNELGAVDPVRQERMVWKLAQTPWLGAALQKKLRESRRPPAPPFREAQQKALRYLDLGPNLKPVAEGQIQGMLSNQPYLLPRALSNLGALIYSLPPETQQREILPILKSLQEQKPGYGRLKELTAPILFRMQAFPTSASMVLQQRVRALEALERMNTPFAWKVIGEMAADRDEPLRTEANAALGRRQLAESEKKPRRGP